MVEERRELGMKLRVGLFILMGLGLNIVVGFAGLLDLGYVAFFAIGAHVAAHFGSAFWGIHFNFLIILVLAIVATAAPVRRRPCSMCFHVTSSASMSSLLLSARPTSDPSK